VLFFKKGGEIDMKTKSSFINIPKQYIITEDSINEKKVVEVYENMGILKEENIYVEECSKTGDSIFMDRYEDLKGEEFFVYKRETTFLVNGQRSFWIFNCYISKKNQA